MIKKLLLGRKLPLVKIQILQIVYSHVISFQQYI